MADTPPTGAELVKDRKGAFKGLFLPTTLLLTIAGGSCAAGWTTAKYLYGAMDGRVTATEIKAIEHEKAIADNARHIAVLEANASNLTARIDEMNRKIDTVINLLLRDRRPESRP
jgi:hypothetical protein